MFGNGSLEFDEQTLIPHFVDVLFFGESHDGAKVVLASQFAEEPLERLFSGFGVGEDEEGVVDEVTRIGRAKALRLGLGRSIARDDFYVLRMGRLITCA